MTILEINFWNDLNNQQKDWLKDKIRKIIPEMPDYSPGDPDNTQSFKIGVYDLERVIYNPKQPINAIIG